jgi:aromatic-L-amino-acid decarboxylase
MTPEEFRNAGHALVDWLADFRTALPDRPVMAQVAPGDVRRAMPPLPSPEGAPFGELLRYLDEVVVPGMTHLQHPRYVGFFPANASLPSVLGDLASTGLGALGITWESCPALTEVEEVVVDWMRELTGLPSTWRGTIHDTASTACLVALLCARERAAGFVQEAGGLRSAPQPMTVYTSAEAHSAVRKAALLAGFGEDNLRLVEVDPANRGMRPERLALRMADDAAAGRRPAVVVATVGTTATTGLDPLVPIVDIAREHGAWVHVDAAMAGSALLLPECRGLFDGLDGADSLSWNPHKWMGAAVDCSLFYVQDVPHLTRVMGTAPSFLRGAAEDVIQYRDWGIPLGRRFRALKLWFLLHVDGLHAIQARLRRDLANARWLADQVEVEPEWRVVAPVPLQTVVVRHEPDGLDGEALDAHTLAWARAVNASGAAYLTPAVIDGQWAVRLSIGAEPTEREDVAAVWDAVRRAAREALDRG